MINNVLTTLILVLMAQLYAFGQDMTTVLTAPDDWKSEQFSIPISFAPDIDYVGFEDLRFAPTWSDPKSEEFWTYTFVWFVDMDSVLTATKLSKDLELYYDGLMKVNDYKGSKYLKPQKTKCSFSDSGGIFEGKINVHDAFFTKSSMTLHARVQQSFCDSLGKQLISFELSPKNFDDKIWDLFDKVELNFDCK